MSWLHSGVRNVVLASLKDMEEMEYFLACYELHLLYAASFVPTLSSHFWPYLGQIVNSDKVFGHFPIENLKGISKLSFLFNYAVKGAEKLQNTKHVQFQWTPCSKYCKCNNSLPFSFQPNHLCIYKLLNNGNFQV